MVLATGAVIGLAQLSVTATYAGTVLPSIMLAGVGLGLVMAPSMAAATLGVEASHAGVASATVNTSQQIGGSIGTALLSSLAAASVTDSVKSALVANPQLAGKPTDAVLAAAQIDGYTTAFWWAAGIFALGALVAALVMPSGVPETDPDAAPVFAH